MLSAKTSVISTIAAVLLFGTTIAPTSADNSTTARSDDKLALGTGISLHTAVRLGDVLKDISTFETKELLLEGKIEKVCQKKGCWMVLRDGDAEVRVTFSGYKLFVPKNSASKSARVQGHILKKRISPKDARHYLEDENAPKEEINKIQGPQDLAMFVATGVEILK